MKKNSWDKKEIIISVLVLLGGMAFTAASFCIYFLVKPLHPAVLAVICVVDFIYTFFTTALACKNLPTKKWLLKGLGVAVGYIPIFIIAAILFEFFCIGEIPVNTFIPIIFYAFFTGPCIFIVMVIALLCLAYG
ncbi:MAG: hypothetical protein K2O81_07100 [Clostridia bacterium]|nr:hypothetical protein [Clostridia bacterium]